MHWHMVQEQQALPWVYGGVDAEVNAFLMPELQQQDGDKTLYTAARAEAKAVARQSGQQTVMPSGVETLRATPPMEEHTGLLCREARGVAAAATEEGAEEALEEVVKDITRMAAATERGQQLQEAATEAAYLRAAVLWHKAHAYRDGLTTGDARRVKKRKKAERSMQGKAQHEAVLAKRVDRWPDKSRRATEVQSKARQRGKQKREGGFGARHQKRQATEQAKQDKA